MADKLIGRLNELRGILRNMDPMSVATLSGAEMGPKSAYLSLSFFFRTISVSLPDLVAIDEQTGIPLPNLHQTLLLYYLSTADGTPYEGRWVSFADLPGGRFYNQAFQGYSGAEVAKHFLLDIGAFEDAASEFGGERLVFGDAAYAFRVLPRMLVAAVYHLGDEEFQSTCLILFDATATHYLPIDGCAVLGSMLAGKLTRG